MVNTPQAVIKVIRNGGTRSPSQIRNQWKYISKGGDVELHMPDAAHGATLLPDEWQPASRDWAQHTGRYALGQRDLANVDLTTHIVVSFPPGTDPENARNAARGWAERMFQAAGDDGMEQDGHDGQPEYFPQTYDYVSAFHTDREHPHMHIVVNRRGSTNDWLKISKRHPVMNYDNMRDVLVEAAADHHIQLDASSRTERGVPGHNLNDAAYRRQQRGEQPNQAHSRIQIIPADQTNRPLNMDSVAGDFGYSNDSVVDYNYDMGGNEPMEPEIPAEIHIPQEDYAQARDPAEIQAEAEARAQRRRQARAAGVPFVDSDDEDFPDAPQDSGSSDSDSDDDSDGGGKPLAAPTAADDNRQSRKRDRNERTPADARASEDDASTSDEDMQDDAPVQAPPRQRRRTEVPDRHMELRSDAARAAAATLAEGMHLRSGTVVPKRTREEGADERDAERNTRPRHR